MKLNIKSIQRIRVKVMLTKLFQGKNPEKKIRTILTKLSMRTLMSEKAHHFVKRWMMLSIEVYSFLIAIPFFRDVKAA